MKIGKVMILMEFFVSTVIFIAWTYQMLFLHFSNSICASSDRNNVRKVKNMSSKRIKMPQTEQYIETQENIITQKSFLITFRLRQNITFLKNHKDFHLIHKMHLFEFAFYTAGTLYALFTEQVLIFYFLLVVGVYILIATFYPGAKEISIRKKIMLGTWTPPSEGVAIVKIKVRLDKVMKLIDTLPKQGRPTLTHFVIKAIGRLLRQCPDVNGKLVFGKFVPYATQDVCCLVDIDGGKDLAIVLVEDVESKGVYEIAQFIKQKGSNIKEKKGDKDHKNRTGIAKFLPAFLVSILIKVSNFLFHYLGISIKPLSIKKNQFGAACLTSVGMIGFQDAIAPFSGFTGCTFFVALNAIIEEPVVQDGKIVVGKVANMNFAVDHRYVDGGKCKNLIPAFKSIFETPEKFLRAERKAEQPKSENKKSQ